MTSNSSRRVAETPGTERSRRDTTVEDATESADPQSRVPVDRVADEVAGRVGDGDDAVVRESIGLFLRRNARREAAGDDPAVTLDESADALVIEDTALRVRTDPSPVRGWSWQRYYLSVSALGLHLLVLGRLDEPLALPIDAAPVVLTTLTLLLVGFVCRRGLRRERTLT